MVQSQEIQLKVGAVAERAGVSVDTVRYYERRGLLSPDQRLPSGYRLYRESVVTRIQLARRLQALGMTLDEVADALRSHDQNDGNCASERWRLESVHERITAQLAELTAVRETIDATLSRCAAGECEMRDHPAEPAQAHPGALPNP